MGKTRWLTEASYVFATLPTWKKSLMTLASVSLFGGLGLQGAGSLGVSDPEAAARPGVARGTQKPSAPENGGEAETRAEAASAPLRLPLDGGEQLAVDGRESDPDPVLPGVGLVPQGGSRTQGANVSEGSRSVGRSVGSKPFEATGETTEARRLFPPYGTERGSRSARGTADGESPGVVEQWAPSLIKGGFSFFVAFSIGCALRIFARISLIVIGSILLVLTLLAHGQYIEVHWDRIAARFDSLAGGFTMGSSGLESFLRSSLPSAAMGGLGLLAGLKKK